MAKKLIPFLFVCLVTLVTLPGWGTACTTGANNDICIFDIDNTGHTIVEPFGKFFKKGEIAQFPEPLVNGSSATTYQSDVKNRWSDGTVRFAIISLKTSFSAGTDIHITFQNNANYATGCTGGTPCGFLNAAAMAGFNSGNWGATFIATPLATTGSNIGAVTSDYKSMLAASDPGSNTFGDGKNNYWLQGPVVTAVNVQDDTSAFSNSFGWHWDGTHMITEGASTHNTLSNITTSNYATINPAGTLYFYPDLLAVKVEFDIELPWTERKQNQFMDFEFKTGSPLVSRYKHTGGRILADVSATNLSTTITSASASFTSTDEGMPIAVYSPYYATGTATFTNGSATITGSGTTWFPGGSSIYSGSYIFCASGPCYGQGQIISTAGSNTSITLSANWTGSSSTGSVAYYIGPLSSANCTITSQCLYTTITHVTNSTTATVGQLFQGGTATNLSGVIGQTIFATRMHKIFWSGTTAPQVRINPNFSDLSSSNAILSYDSTYPNLPGKSLLIPSPNSDSGTTGCLSCTSWTTWSTTDKGDIGGQGGISAFTPEQDSNSEGTPLEREDLVALYNDAVGCGTANSDCAKANQMLTATSGSIDSGLTAGNVAGGAGTWNMTNNVPFHIRESRTAAAGAQTSGNKFYCAVLENKAVAGNATTADCNTASDGTVGADSNVTAPVSSATNDATGKPFSGFTHSGDQFAGFNDSGPYPVVAVGAVTPGGWSEQGCAHWWLQAYPAYLQTGSYFYLEEEQMAAAYCLAGEAPGAAGSLFTGNGFFRFLNPQGWILRSTAWSLQEISRAAFITPDSRDAYQDRQSGLGSFYQASMNSTLEILEGFQGKTGTVLTPATTNPSGINYNYNSAHRWDWGRHTIASNAVNTGSNVSPVLVPTLHMLTYGICQPNATDAATYLYGDPGASPYLTSSGNVTWMYNALGLVLAEMRRYGYSQASYLSDETLKQITEKTLDPNYNPYLSGTAFEGVKQPNSTTCNSGVNTDPYMPSWATMKAAITGNAATSFKDNIPTYEGFPCADHAYAMQARALAALASQFSINSGGLLGSAAWTWMQANVPYENNAAWQATGECISGGSDEQVKFAIVPDGNSPATPGSIQTQNTIRKAGTVMQ